MEESVGQIKNENAFQIYRGQVDMDGKQWEKIRKNLDEISNVIHPKDILPRLIQANVIDVNDKQKLEDIPACRDRMQKLCLILKTKLPEKKAFRSFLDAVKDIGSIEKSLSEKIDQTETNSDDSVTAEVDLRQIEAKAREIIGSHFTNRKDAETPLSCFMEMLCLKGAFTGCGKTWTNEDLKEFIKDQFVGVEICTKNKPGEKSRGKKIYVKNVAKLSTPTGQSSDPETTLKNISSSQPKPETDVSSLTPTQLKVVLEKYFRAKGLKIEPLLEMERNEISGDIFLLLTEEAIKEVAPSASYGAQCHLKNIIKDFKEPQKSILYSDVQFVRKFDQPVQPNFFYAQGKCVSLEPDFPHIDKKTSRIKTFHTVKSQNETEVNECIATKAIKFFAACINERQNGTIYFGINSKTFQTHKAGEVIGIVISKDKLLEKVAKMFKTAFHPKQLKCIQDVVRPARFVPVHSENVLCTHVENIERWVIEYDIVPMNTILEEEFVKIDMRKFPFSKKKSKLGGIFRLSKDGRPRALNFDEEHDFDALKQKILTQRNQEENKKVEGEIQNQRERLQNLVTGGHPSLEDDIIPFLMLGPRVDKSDSHSLSQIRSFVKCLSPEVVFDFDPDSYSKGIYHHVEEDENLRVQTLDNFDVSKGDSAQTLSQLLSQEKNRIWVFCNGYEHTDMKSLTPAQWNMQRKFAFQEALKSYLSNDMFRKERILLIVCLFSHDQGALVEACDEILLHLPQQWIVLAESENEAQPWQDMILQRNRVDQRKDLLNRCIVGMTWQQISTCFKDWCRNEEFQMCKIPHSNGSFIEVPEKTCKRWCDVEILSVTDPISLTEDEDIRSKLAQEVEDHFYKGGEVKWENFWFKDQVQSRTVQQPLKREVKKALCGKKESNEERLTLPVFFYHQPGAGGTTVAKQVLWELRTDYRCCIILDITQQTCCQLVEIYLHEEENPKPLLLLCDNKEDDKLERFRKELEKAGQETKSQMKGNSCIFCVILICLRCPSLAVDKYQAHLKILRQELDAQELHLFKSKHKILEKRYADNKDNNTDPRFLISFNLLKDNFDQKNLQNLVREYLQHITDKKEREMLTIVSFLNTFDADFQQITVYLFDAILQTETYIYQNTHASYASLSRRTKWEARVSSSFKVLMNISKSNHQLLWRRKTIRIFSQLLAAQILNCIREETKQSLSEIILHLLASKLFDEDNKALVSIQKIIRNVIIKRQYKIEHSSLKREQFSQLILHVQKNESNEKALSVLTTFYNLRKDAFTAQQIARFHIELKDYISAERYAQNALMCFPNHSYLLNTCGRVFLSQLTNEIESDSFQMESGERFDSFVDLFNKCSHFFQKSQAASDACSWITPVDQNSQSYIDELQAIVKFICGLKRCLGFESQEQFHRYLVEDEFDKENSNISKPKRVLKNLFQDSQRIIKTLDDVFMPCESQEKAIDEYKIHERNAQLFKFSNLKMKLMVYLQENTDEVPSNLNEREKCEYRYRRVKSKDVKFIKNLTNRESIDKLTKCYEESYNLLLPNVNGQFCCFEYLKTMLDIVIVLVIHEKPSCGISYQETLAWSFDCCFKHDPKTLRGNILLENYLYFFLLHFPTQERNAGILSCSCDAFLGVWQRWCQLYIDISEKQDYDIKKYDKESPLFFLGKGKALDDLVYFGEGSRKSKIDDFLLSNREKLRMMSGTLMEEGKKIQFFIISKEGLKSHIDIPTSHAIDKTFLWQKEVYFFLGFSLAGLKAFCVCDDKSNCDKDLDGPEV